MFSFKGRSTRLAYIGFLILFGIFFWLPGPAIDSAWNLVPLQVPSADMFLTSVIWLCTVLFWISLFLLWTATVRRLHDMDFSGWWCLAVYLVPVLMLVLCVWPGTRGGNRFG